MKITIMKTVIYSTAKTNYDHACAICAEFTPRSRSPCRHSSSVCSTAETLASVGADTGAGRLFLQLGAGRLEYGLQLLLCLMCTERVLLLACCRQAHPEPCQILLLTNLVSITRVGIFSFTKAWKPVLGVLLMRLSRRVSLTKTLNDPSIFAPSRLPVRSLSSTASISSRCFHSGRICHTLLLLGLSSNFSLTASSPILKSTCLLVSWGYHFRK